MSCMFPQHLYGKNDCVFFTDDSIQSNDALINKGTNSKNVRMNETVRGRKREEKKREEDEINGES